MRCRMVLGADHAAHSLTSNPTFTLARRLKELTDCRTSLALGEGLDDLYGAAS